MSGTERPANVNWRIIAAVVVAALLAVGFVVAQRGDNTDGAQAEPGGLTGGDFHSLVVDPDNPDHIYVGGHEAVSVSKDGGSTWTEMGALANADAMGWAFDPDTIYVSGHPGLIRSADAGATFVAVNDGLPDTDVHAFGGLDGTFYGAGPGAGFFVGAPDSGWEIRTTDVGQSFFGRVLVDPADADHIIAADAAAGVTASLDGGRTWQLLDTGLTSAVWLSAPGPALDTILASGPGGVARSTDGGATWQPLPVPDGVSLVETVPGSPDQIYAGRHDGQRVTIEVSNDGGTTWSTP